MSVMGLKKIGWRVGVWGELNPRLFWIFGIFLSSQSPSRVIGVVFNERIVNRMNCPLTHAFCEDLHVSRIAINGDD